MKRFTAILFALLLLSLYSTVAAAGTYFPALDMTDGNTMTAVISITAITCTFGVPLLIVLVVFYFRYKNRKAQYRLAEQAIASGQPLPPDFFGKVNSERSMFNKGVQNTSIGIGLFIFLWAITGNFGVGTIGLLIMFMGLGQLVIYYMGQHDK
jgi:hypothetical protein